MRKTVPTLLIVAIGIAVTFPISAASYLDIFSRTIELPDECLFSPNLQNHSSFGAWTCGLKAEDYGGRIVLEDRATAEQSKPWNYENKINERKVKSGDILLLRFDIQHDGRKFQVAFVCDDATCLKVMGSRNERWVDAFLEQFQFGEQHDAM